MIFKLDITHLSQTCSYAEIFSYMLPKKGVITFSGDMGSGKTTFIAAMIRALYNQYNLDIPVISSPTFALIHEYDISDIKVVHCDLYRINSPHEIVNLGFDDYQDNALCLIEWPNKAGDYLDEAVIKCNFFIDNHRRYLTLSPSKRYSLEYQEKFAQFKNNKEV